MVILDFLPAARCGNWPPNDSLRTSHDLGTASNGAVERPIVAEALNIETPKR